MKTFETLAKLNPKTYIKGGYVRDSIVGITPRDVDFACVGDYEQVATNLEEVCDWVVKTAPRHNTMLFKMNGVTYEITTVDSLVINADFTINSMLLDIDNNLIDRQGGLADIANGILRQASDTALVSDPIRTIRGVRFLYEYGLTLEEDTGVEISRLLPTIRLYDTVSKFRSRNELKKILASQKRREILEFLTDNGLYIDPKWISRLDKHIRF